MTARKHSRKREAILKTIRATTAHPTAEAVYTALKPDYPDLSLGTVYRNINLFKEEGSVVSVGVVGGQERLDGNTSPHPHFICTGCGAVYDIPGGTLDAELNAKVESETGFKVFEHTLVFRGRCAECAVPNHP